MRARWQALSVRDRRVLGGGGLVVALLLAWAFIWHPLALSREQLRARTGADRASLAWMRSAQTQLPSLGAGATHTAVNREGKSLLALADATARGAGLAAALKRVEPTGARSVRVSFEAANFDLLVGWIEELGRDYAVEASDLSADRAEATGLVNARVTLEDR